MHCPLHKWSYPCSVCAWERQNEDRRLWLRMNLGAIGLPITTLIAEKLRRDGIQVMARVTAN